MNGCYCVERIGVEREAVGPGFGARGELLCGGASPEFHSALLEESADGGRRGQAECDNGELGPTVED
jgi:hypothetical protein